MTNLQQRKWKISVVPGPVCALHLMRETCVQRERGWGGDVVVRGCLGQSDHQMIFDYWWSKGRGGGQQNLCLGLSEGRFWPVQDPGWEILLVKQTMQHKQHPSWRTVWKFTINLIWIKGEILIACVRLSICSIPLRTLLNRSIWACSGTWEVPESGGSYLVQGRLTESLLLNAQVADFGHELVRVHEEAGAEQKGEDVCPLQTTGRQRKA